MDLGKRCNYIFDCSDRSDEDNCEPLLIDKDSYWKILPPALAEQKTEIFVIAAINGISDIDQMSMTFRGNIKLRLLWRDSRIKFRDLGSYETFLNKKWIEQIWLPPLTFSNTLGDTPILSEDLTDVKILKQGGYVHNDITDLHEGTLFHGNENDFQLQGKYEKTFKCLFELKKFPFDTQHCTMNLKVPYEIRNFTTLKPKNLSFTGK